MTQALFGLIGAAAAAAGMWYWKKEGVCTFQKEKKKELCLAAGTLAVSLLFALFLGYEKWDLLLNIKLLAVYVMTLAASVVDWKKRIISNRLVLGALIVRLVIFLLEYLFRRETFLQNMAASLWGMLFGFGFLFLISILTKRSIGFGDVKLFTAIGIYMGFWGTFHVLFYALLYTAVISCGLLILKKADKKSRIPFAPFIYAGVITTVLFCSF